MDFTKGLEIGKIDHKNNSAIKYIDFLGTKCFVSPMPIKLALLLKNKIELSFFKEKELRDKAIKEDGLEKNHNNNIYDLSLKQAQHALELSYMFVSYFINESESSSLNQIEFEKVISIKDINLINKEIFDELESDFEIVNSIFTSSFFLKKKEYQ